jgi:hypothetical protein
MLPHILLPLLFSTFPLPLSLAQVLACRNPLAAPFFKKVPHVRAAVGVCNSNAVEICERRKLNTAGEGAAVHVRSGGKGFITLRPFVGRVVGSDG